MSKSIGCAIVLLLGSSAAFADESRTVPTGINRRIDFFASVNPDCSSIGMPTVRLVDGPDHGVITTDKAKDFKPFPRGNVRSKCNSRRLSGLRLFYQSTSEFFGVDRVRLLILSASGDEREATYVIQVK